MADATWYGSFRALVHDKDQIAVKDNGSRWGVKGSSEVSEGLTAVYRYEAALDLSSAKLASNDDGTVGGNRLSFVGLSGGFGTITMGRIWTATYNHAGVLTDNGIASSNSGHATLRESNMVSYSTSVGPASFQLDLQMHPKGKRDGEGAKEDKNKSIDMHQFGVTFDAGVATIGAAFKSKHQRFEHSKDESDFITKDRGPGEAAQLFGIAVKPVAGGTATMIGDLTVTKARLDELTFAATGKTEVSALAFSVPVGGVNLYAGWHQVKHSGKIEGAVDFNNDNTDDIAVNLKGSLKDKMVLGGVSGSIGDTGMSFAVNMADVKYDKDRDKKDENPWNAHIAKSLGGGASVALEYIDHDQKDVEDEILLQLQVDF